MHIWQLWRSSTSIINGGRWVDVENRTCVCHLQEAGIRSHSVDVVNVCVIFSNESSWLPSADYCRTIALTQLALREGQVTISTKRVHVKFRYTLAHFRCKKHFVGVRGCNSFVCRSLALFGCLIYTPNLCYHTLVHNVYSVVYWLKKSKTYNLKKLIIHVKEKLSETSLQSWIGKTSSFINGFLTGIGMSLFSTFL